MRPFNKIRDYFSEKSGKQRVFIVICFVLLAVFVFFFIKGNFFDNKEPPRDETSVSDTAQSGESSDKTQAAQDNEVKFHINLLDLVILLVVIVLFVIHKIREKIRHRRM